MPNSPSAASSGGIGFALSLATILPVQSKNWEIPVCYGNDFGPDLEFVAANKNLTVESLISIHSAVQYTVFMIGFLPGFLSAIMGADFGSYRGATVHYAGIPNRHTITWRHELPVRTGWWRGLGLLANTFAVESFMDELAHKAGIDPLQFHEALFDVLCYVDS